MSQERVFSEILLSKCSRAGFLMEPYYKKAEILEAIEEFLEQKRQTLNKGTFWRDCIDELLEDFKK